MKTNLKAVAIAALIAGAAPAFAQSQLVANAGLTPEEARGLSLTEIAAAKFNRDSAGDGQQRAVRSDGVTVISRSTGGGAWSPLAANAGLTPAEARGLSLTELAAAKFNREADGDDQQTVVQGGRVTAIGRSAGGSDVSQLAANAGLSPEEARGLSLAEIAAIKFDREAD